MDLEKMANQWFVPKGSTKKERSAQFKNALIAARRGYHAAGIGERRTCTGETERIMKIINPNCHEVRITMACLELVEETQQQGKPDVDLMNYAEHTILKVMRRFMRADDAHKRHLQYVPGLDENIAALTAYVLTTETFDTAEEEEQSIEEAIKRMATLRAVKSGNKVERDEIEFDIIKTCI